LHGRYLGVETGLFNPKTIISNSLAKEEVSVIEILRGPEERWIKTGKIGYNDGGLSPRAA